MLNKIKSAFGGKKILSAFLGLALVFALVSVKTARADEAWDLSGTYTIDFVLQPGGGIYTHIMTVTDMDLVTGNFSGVGNYQPGTPTWTHSGNVSGSGVNFQLAYDGSTYYVDVVGTIASDGSMSGTAGNASQKFDWSTTAGSATFNRSAEITSPTANEYVSGVVSFDAVLVDKDGDDSVQWAVREGTCAAGIGTVFGNVDGHSDSSTWDGATFHASTDTSGWTDGDYCFVFNPTESAGDTSIRETQEFVVDNTAPEQVDGMTIWQNGVEIGCGAFVNKRGITVDWNDSTDPNFAYYRYQADDGEGSIDFTTTVVPSERSGNIRDLDGTYQYQVQAVDLADNVGDWSGWCYVTLDREAPVITLELPVDESPHNGTIPLEAECNETCDYINFWWRSDDQTFADSKTERQYHYDFGDRKIYEWELDPWEAQLWGGGEYEMVDGNYYFYAAGKDLAGNWARTETVMITLEKDSDGDGVLDVDDLCSETTTDVTKFGDEWGVNRWYWDGNEWKQETNKPGKTSNKSFDMNDTHGCSCKQILERMVEATGEDFEGHYKFGCSSSILEDWNRGIYNIGPTFIETVEVPASGIVMITTNTLEAGVDYFLEVSGTYKYANWCSETDNRCLADAEWAYRGTNDPLGIYPPDWIKGEIEYALKGYPAYSLDLLVIDGGIINIDWGGYSDAHEYRATYPGVGNQIGLQIHDTGYGDNEGSLSVDIIEDKWVNLW